MASNVEIRDDEKAYGIEARSISHLIRLEPVILHVPTLCGIAGDSAVFAHCLSTNW